MIAWRRDEEEERPIWSMPWPKTLRGRSIAARVDDNTLALILVHYELDKSTWQTCLEGRQLLCVDAIALSPAITSVSCRVLLSAGVKESLADMAACHSMRLQYTADLCTC